MIPWHEIFTIGHVAGVVLGGGAAFTSDFIFLSSAKDGTISKTEMRFIKLSSHLVWLGLAIIVTFGLALFLEDPARYLASAKFLAKMSIVLIIIINGLLFHLSHIPRMVRHSDTHFPSSDEFVRSGPFLMASGAISVTSWISAFILGSLRHPPFSYTEIMGVYLIAVFVAILVALFKGKRIIPSHRRRGSSRR